MSCTFATPTEAPSRTVRAKSANHHAVVAVFLILLISSLAQLRAACSRGAALYFDGNSRVIVPDHNDLTFDSTDSFAWEAWVKVTMTDWAYGHEWVTILAKDNPWGEYWLAVRQDGRVEVRINGQTAAMSEYTMRIPVNEWHHVGVSCYEGSLEIYIDGRRIGSGRAPSMKNGNRPLLIGACASDFTYGMVGEIDEVRLWKKYRSEYGFRQDARVGISSLSPGLVALWRCDDHIGTVLSDATTGGHDGSIKGASFVASGLIYGPEATVMRPTAIGAMKATLNGHIFNWHYPSEAWFEWGLASNYGNKSARYHLPEGYYDTNVSATLTGLVPCTTYHYRLMTDGLTCGVVPGEDQSFTTLPTVPAAITEPAMEIGFDSAQLSGAVADMHAPYVMFEWGPTSQYGEWTIGRQYNVAEVPIRHVESISGLAPRTTYHYRIAALDLCGPVYGNDQTFTTVLAPPPPPRIVYVQYASPPGDFRATVTDLVEGQSYRIQTSTSLMPGVWTDSYGPFLGPPTWAGGVYFEDYNIGWYGPMKFYRAVSP